MGEQSHLSKITEKEAIKICEMISKGKNNEEISNKLGIQKKIIQHIRSGETWRYISKNYTFPKLNEYKPFSISDETIHNICKVLEKDAKERKLSDPDIAKMFNVKRELVKDIRTKRRRKNISSLYNF